MPFNQWKVLSAALISLALTFTANATPRPEHATIIVSMDTHATYVGKGPAIQGVPQAELRAAALLELSTPHACGSNEVYLTPESSGIPKESFRAALAEIQELINNQTPLLMTLSACDGKRAFFEKIRECTPQACGKLTASLVDGKLYLDEEYVPTSKSLAAFFLKMPIPYDSKRKAWKAKIYYADTQTLRRDYFVNAKDFVSGIPVLDSKSYYANGKLGQSFHNDAKGQLQGESIDYSDSGVVSKREHYLNNELEGWQTTYHDNGQEAESYNWHQGKRVDGEYLEHDENGAVIGRISYRNDVPDGPAMSYYPSGKLKDSSTFVAGMAQGASTSYFEDGTVRSTRNNVDSSPDGWVISYYADGKVQEKQFFQQQVQRSYATWNAEGIQTVQWQWDEQHREQGDFKKWFESGQLQDHRIYKDGKLQGPAITWYENGQMSSSIDYVEGREQGVMRLWKQDGTPNGECRYEAGVRQGECT